jgi:hypothetical protein
VARLDHNLQLLIRIHRRLDRRKGMLLYISELWLAMEASK